MAEQVNPYSAPQTAIGKGKFRRFNPFWPESCMACVMLSYLVSPIIFQIVDLLGWFIEPWLGVDDFGLTVLVVTLPACWLYGLSLWVRGFKQRLGVAGGILGLLVVPLWFFPTAMLTLLCFPFGRGSSSF